MHHPDLGPARIEGAIDPRVVALIGKCGRSFTPELAYRGEEHPVGKAVPVATRLQNGLGGDKGQRAQMQRFVDLIEKGDVPPTTLEALLDTTRLTLLAIEAARSRQTLSLR